MTDSGPTTVGSIVGKLKMDRGQWVAMMAATKADIRDLESSDPDIHIDVNAAEAIAKLKATGAAADALGTKTDELGRKTRKATEETVKANDANRTTVTRVGAISTAVALLLPLLAPVAAAAVGVGGAMLGMGAAGILAIIGINREMDAGTAVGGAYRDGIDSLKGSMNTLASTAAVNMLASFQRVVTETRAALPGLNTQVGQFSSLLGRSGANLFTGAINSLRVLNPLFLTAAVYLLTLTEGFERWTSSSGIEDFGGYALAMLPQVTDVLGKLASMVMHILQALAPLGAVGMVVLAGLAELINAIPVEVLSQLIVTLTWGAIAFKAWGFVAPMLASIATSMGAVGVATTIATGPIGWVVAGLAALAGIFAVVIAQNTGATQAMQDYTAAVDADTGAIGENVRAKAAQKLLDDGAFESAKKLGISQKTVMDATLGNAAAQRVLSEALDTGTQGSKINADQLEKSGLSRQTFLMITDQLRGSVESNSVAIDGEIARYNELQNALSTTTGATKAQQAADEATAAALGISVGALQEAAGSQEEMEAATAKATAEMYMQNDAAGLLDQALDKLNGKALSAAETQNQFESQLVRMGDAMATNGAQLSGMDAAAIANRGSLLDLIQSSQDAATAFRDQGGSAEDTRLKMIAGRDAIIEQAVANGANREEVTKYIDELYKIPETLPPTKIEVDKAAAEAAIANFVRTRTMIIRAVVQTAPGNASFARNGVDGVAAMGATIRGLAGGGSGGSVVGPGTAGSDNAGLFRLGHGEEVISNVFGQADRNRSLLKQINAGYTPAPSSAGSAVATASPSMGGSTMVALSPEDRRLLKSLEAHVNVVIGDDQIASSARRGNANRAWRGDGRL